MRDPGRFDAFYKSARERVLVQAYALTGDSTAAQSASRDAFVIAWHHWRKVSVLDDPETYVRPLAWRLALRRHTGRVWHRERGIDPDVRATLDALGKLTLPQRQLLLLTQLASVSLPEMAREVGLTQEVAERELQLAAVQFALHRGIEGPAIRSTLDGLGPALDGVVSWPRATIIRRAGAARRRSHTVVGAAVAVGAVALSGLVVGDAAGVRPTLHRPALTAPEPSAPAPAPVAPELEDADLLAAAEVSDLVPARSWRELSSGADLRGVMADVPCDLDDVAPPAAERAVARSFEARVKRGEPGLALAQAVEAAPRLPAAERRFDRLAAAVAGCATPRTQLLTTSTPDAVGDEAVQFVVRTSGRQPETHVVSLARTGVYTTAVVLALDGADDPPVRRVAAALARAVDAVCDLPGAGACAVAAPGLEARPPLRAGRWPAMLSEFDLPPIDGVPDAWVGTPATRPTTNDAASSCDRTSFTGSFRKEAWSRSRTRTFVLPTSSLPATFGLTETVGALPRRTAGQLVEQVRSRMADCPDRELNTEVERVARSDRGDRSLTVWRLEIDVSDARSITFWMALVRDGTAVGQIGFLPSAKATLSERDIVALAERAQDRLAQLDPPTS